MFPSLEEEGNKDIIIRVSACGRMEDQTSRESGLYILFLSEWVILKG